MKAREKQDPNVEPSPATEARPHSEVKAREPISVAEDSVFEQLLEEVAESETDLEPVLAPGQQVAAGRFRIVRQLGQGGMGRVYEAHDEAYGAAVALKTLSVRDSGLLLGLKNEFRSLADVRHPNLVELYELICDDELWLLTMELVRGRNFTDWLEERRGAREAREPAYERAVRDVLLPVAKGITALHAAGKVHRDLKPSNIMVAGDGRVIILDFGLVTEARAANGTHERDVVSGTPAYLAPEQAAGLAVTAACDWYALGVIVYEALTGRLPFAGAVAHIVQAKQREDAPALEALAPQVAEDLRSLCHGLLARDPARRPQAARVLETLGRASTGAPREPEKAAVPASERPELGLFGRHAELAQLRDAFAEAARRHVVGLWVHGPSGIGKSALVGHFLGERAADAGAFVLRGRCYERESVPYKACDALIDSLSRQLSAWPSSEVPGASPASPRALTRLFPVLERVPWIAHAARLDRVLPSDQQALRRLGFLALRDLLHQIGQHRTLVLCIDDLQWGDLDSAKLLSVLLAAPAPAAGLLFLGSFRSDERASGELLPALAADEELAQTFRPRELALGPLPAEDALEMARQTLGGSPALALKIAREADGNPFFIGQLARHVGEEPGRAWPSVGGAILARVIEERVARLPPDARGLLEVVAVSGRPVESGVALLASDLRPTDRRVLARLQAAGLLRARRTDQGELLESYHDRVREAVAGALAPQVRRGVHRTIAQTLERTGVLDSERLALHFREAGEPGKTTTYATLAGDDAYRALAFERAATWYTTALDADVAAPDERRRLQERLGDALTYAGRGAQAARHYLEAARASERAEARELERRAAEQLLVSGHTSEGLATLTGVLGASGIAGPSRGPALGRLLYQRLRLRLRGLDFVTREAARVEPRVLRRVDACAVAARTLVVREPIKGGIFGAMHLRLALDAGEPSRIVEGLATEIMYSAIGGSRATARVSGLVARARRIELAETRPAAQAYLTTALAGCALLAGRFAQAAEEAKVAETIYRERCTGVTGPLNLARTIWAPAMLFMGEVPAAMGPLAEWLEDAREREDLEAEGQLSVYRLYGALAAGDIAAVREGVTSTLARWHPEQRETAGMTAVHVLVGLECYARATPQVLAAVRELYRPFFRSLLTRVQLYRVVVMGYCANLELAIAAQGWQRTERLRRAERLAVRLSRERVRHADALAHLTRGTAARLVGDLDGAVRHLRRACADFEGDRQMLWAACARVRLGGLLGGSEGALHQERANDEMTRRGVTHPARFASVYAPGYPD